MAKEKKDVLNNHDCSTASQNGNSGSCAFEETTKDALENIFETKQETYDDFINSFIYLKSKKDDIVNGVRSNTSPSPDIHDNATNNVPKMMLHLPNTDCNSDTSKVVSTNDDNEEMLQEMSLGPGNLISSVLIGTKDLCHDGKLHVKLDNFVDDESMGDDTSYHPSVFEKYNEDNPKMIPCPNNVYEVILPGEIDDNCVPTNIPVHSRCLSIRTRCSMADKKPEEPVSFSKETGSGEVEKFQLDDDFDYDNIQTTPKFGFLHMR